MCANVKFEMMLVRPSAVGIRCKMVSISCDHCSQWELDLLSILLLYGSRHSHLLATGRHSVCSDLIEIKSSCHSLHRAFPQCPQTWWLPLLDGISTLNSLGENILLIDDTSDFMHENLPLIIPCWSLYTTYCLDKHLVPPHIKYEFGDASLDELSNRVDDILLD